MGRPDLQRESQVSPLFPSVCLSCKKNENKLALSDDFRIEVITRAIFINFYMSRSSEDTTYNPGMAINKVASCKQLNPK